MGNNRWKLGWFNAWVGYASLFLFIPSFLFLFAYELFLKRSFVSVIVSHPSIEVIGDSSEMRIITNTGTYYYYNKDNFKLITEFLSKKNPVELWYDKENSITADFRVNGFFLLKRTNFEIGLYFIGLVLSGSMLVLSTILVIRTKGWGSYELMEKHRKKIEVEV